MALAMGSERAAVHTTRSTTASLQAEPVMAQPYRERRAAHSVSDDEDQTRLFETSRWTLRFRGLRVEEAFCQSRQEKMFKNIYRCCMIMWWCMLPPVLVRIYDSMTTSDVFPWEADLPRTPTTTVFLSFFAVFFLVCGVCARSSTVQSRVGFGGGEVFVCMICALMMVYGFVFIVIVPSGRKDSTVWVALLLDTVLTTTHLALPVRFTVLFGIDLSFCAFLATYTIFITPTPDVLTLIVFTGLCIGAVCGAWSTELNERALFSTIVDERTRRALAEFHACRKGSSQSELSDPSKDDLTSVSKSVASTTATETMFKRLFGSDDKDKDKALEQIVGLGMREQWLIKADELDTEMGEMIGSGGQAQVFKGWYGYTPVAVKRYKQNRDNLNPRVLDELRILRHVRHPNITLFHGACIQISSSCSVALQEESSARTCEISLVLELLQGISLWEYLVKSGDRPSMAKDRSAILLGVIQALLYLHNRRPPVVHSDLKPDNIVVEQRNGLPFTKLLDFGLSRTVTRNAKLVGGTKSFAGPELTGATGRARACTEFDVYSFGRLLSIMLMGGRMKESGGIAGWWPLCTELQAKWLFMIGLCTEQDPLMRPSMEQVYNQMYNPHWRTGSFESAPSRRASSSGTDESTAEAAGEMPGSAAKGGPSAPTGTMCL